MGNPSPTKITRFAEKLNLKGYRELKLRLSDISKSIIIDGNFVNVSEKINNNSKVFYKKYVKIHNESFEKQFNYLSHKDIKIFNDCFTYSKRIFIFAFNLSYNISKNFVQRMCWKGLNIISESDPVSIETYINTITKNDCVILITISGNNSLIKGIAEQLTKKTNLLGIGNKTCDFQNLFQDFIKFDSD
ncbi:RpiR family transcriptional regulator [Entomoplasma ellychniae]|uniref:RpiR family transcriptional regulator n=1 Tax=Entomoplasma ellychniae TaxID=2114 RepID=A0A8E2UE75_9MOLU|nr:MurR/RpiR family transcriptional regulator [Entomoplasma ellychniae]PPE04818.1 RpiR family transcriptional regulator [Entomoplasma ellychniae]